MVIDLFIPSQFVHKYVFDPKWSVFGQKWSVLGTKKYPETVLRIQFWSVIDDISFEPFCSKTTSIVLICRHRNPGIIIRYFDSITDQNWVMDTLWKFCAQNGAFSNVNGVF